MKIIFHILTIVAILTAVSSSANAQTVSQDYRETISELFSITNMRDISEETVTITYDKMGLEFSVPTSQVVNEMFDSFWNDVLDKYAVIYAKYYTLEELRQLCEFYKTPLGEKVNKINPIINRDKLSVIDEYLPEATSVLKKYLVSSKTPHNPHKKRKTSR